LEIPDKKYDFVVIGSGLGGLLCSYILASEGHSVIVLEKNNQLGGNLQVFSRDKCIFDTGVHYIGSLDEGENLNKFFKYFGLLDNIKLKRMDDNAYDIIRFQDGKEYKHGQGYPNFISNLLLDFPDEANAINAFCDKVQDVCKCFPLYNLETEISIDYFLSNEIRELNAYEYIASLTSNVRLQNVLAGSNPLYAGVKEKTPFYVHALILNSYISGSYKLIDGGSQIANYLSKAIRKMGGEIFKRKKVIGANYNEDGKISQLVLDTGELVHGVNFISNMHPAMTIDIFGENRFLNAYKKRVKSLENTMSSFTLHVVFHKNTFKYLNHNIYQYHVDDVWQGTSYTEKTWPEGYFICTPASSKSEDYADSMSVMTYMSIDETKKWDTTFNTTTAPEDRGEEYAAFKKNKEDILLKKLEEVFPGINSKIKKVYSSTPLTFRDYIGNHDGSMYGILKDSNNPIKSSINTKTKIPNLYLTGQNLIFHGILGVTIGAFVTCFEFVDRYKLIEKVKKQ
jgi:all-trans-retinol 13,14-reductase